MRELIRPQKFLSRAISNLPVQFWVQRLVDVPILLKWGRLSKGGSVLEVGCGSGRLAQHLSKKLKCKNYVAVDADPRTVSQADARLAGDAKVIFQVADPLKLPFPNESFDAVISMDTLHRIPNWKKAIREIHRVLKKNGRFLLRDYSIETFCIPGIGLILQKVIDKPYDQMFDQIELLTFIRKNGFAITHQNDSSWMLMMAATKQAHQKE